MQAESVVRAHPGTGRRSGTSLRFSGCFLMSVDALRLYVSKFYLLFIDFEREGERKREEHRFVVPLSYALMHSVVSSCMCPGPGSNPPP